MMEEQYYDEQQESEPELLAEELPKQEMINGKE